MTPAEEQFHAERPVTLFALIAERFEQLELPHWTAVVFSWLARYDGLTHCYFEDEDASPTLEVLRIINDLPADVTDRDVAAVLATAKFLSWRIKHPDTGERWDPLACSLYDFIGIERPPVCWQWEGAYPSSEAIEQWLLDQLQSHTHKAR